MEPTAERPFNKTVYHPVVFKSYRIIKKILKYSMYGIVIYFACEGFMSWK